MKTTKPISDKSIVIKLAPLDPTKISKGHQPHRGGAGAHRHKADRRQGNRSQQTNRIVNEY